MIRALALFVALTSAAVAQEAPTVTAEEVETAVDKGLASEDAVVAARAEEVVLRAGPRALAPLVRALLRKDVQRRRRAADLLGRIGTREAIGPLVLALPNAREDEALKLAIARSLCALGQKDGVSALIDLLESRDRRTRLRAIIALRRYTHKNFGFQHDGSAALRASSVERWRIWWRANAASFELL